MFPDLGTLELGLGGGSAGGASGSAGTSLAMPMNTPFDFDSSGWVVNLQSPGATTTASGNTGANPNNQTATPVASAGAGVTPTANVPAANMAATLGGNTMPLLLAAVGVFLVLSHKL